jgi:hypothetical protein
MEMILIEQKSPEWDSMWKWVAEHPINENIEHPTVALNDESGEAWQYMGSFRQKNKVIHEFRHRHHPKTGRREYLKVAGSVNITDEQINKIIKK